MDFIIFKFMKYVIISGLIGLFLCSCQKADEERVLFEEAQPIAVDEEKVFDKTLQGTYVSCTDTNEKLRIYPNRMVSTIEYNHKSFRRDLAQDTSIKINTNDDEAIRSFLKDEGAERIFIKADTIYYSLGRQIDTLFSISDQNVLKEFKGSYFLNKRKETGLWTLTRLEKKKEYLIFENINPTDSLLKYDFAKKESNDTIVQKYVLTPDQKGFKRLNRSEFFMNTKCFIKI